MKGRWSEWLVERCHLLLSRTKEATLAALTQVKCTYSIYTIHLSYLQRIQSTWPSHKSNWVYIDRHTGYTIPTLSQTATSFNSHIPTCPRSISHPQQASPPLGIESAAPASRLSRPPSERRSQNSILPGVGPTGNDGNDKDRSRDDRGRRSSSLGHERDIQYNHSISSTPIHLN